MIKLESKLENTNSSHGTITPDLGLRLRLEAKVVPRPGVPRRGVTRPEVRRPGGTHYEATLIWGTQTRGTQTWIHS